MNKHSKKVFGIVSLALLSSCNMMKSQKKEAITVPDTTSEVPKQEKTMQKHTFADGLTYEILQEGTGEVAQKGKKATVHYTGVLAKDGKKFDSSLDRNRPFTFLLGAGQVIKGWDKGVEGMKVGEKRRLIIPAELGYGVRGAPPAIPSGADLIFDVELLKVG